MHPYRSLLFFVPARKPDWAHKAVAMDGDVGWCRHGAARRCVGAAETSSPGGFGARALAS